MDSTEAPHKFDDAKAFVVLAVDVDVVVVVVVLEVVVVVDFQL